MRKLQKSGSPHKALHFNILSFKHVLIHRFGLQILCKLDMTVSVSHI
jgi:hypothetical protein